MLRVKRLGDCGRMWEVFEVNLCKLSRCFMGSGCKHISLTLQRVCLSSQGSADRARSLLPGTCVECPQNQTPRCTSGRIFSVSPLQVWSWRLEEEMFSFCFLISCSNEVCSNFLFLAIWIRWEVLYHPVFEFPFNFLLLVHFYFYFF